MDDEYARLSDTDFRALLERQGKALARYARLELYEYDGQTWACLASEEQPDHWTVMGPYARRPGPDSQ